MYPTKHRLFVHKGRLCKGKRTARKFSRKGTVADRITSWIKVEKHQDTYEKVMIGSEELEKSILSLTWVQKSQKTGNH